VSAGAAPDAQQAAVTVSAAVSLTDALTAVAERYGNEAWCFEHSPQPDATATSVFKTPEGLVRCYLALHGPTIKSTLFTGDFNAVPEPLARFEASLRIVGPWRAR